MRFHLWLLTLFSLHAVTHGLCSVYVIPSIVSHNEGDGTLDNPFSSIDRARDYLRQEPCSSVRRVALYPTYYFLSDRPLIFDQRDAWTVYTQMTKEEKRSISVDRKQHLIELETPVISGGIQLTDWTDDRGIWTIQLPMSQTTVTQLFVNGMRARRSRYPVSGTYTYEKGLNNRTALAYRGFIYRENQFNNLTLSSTSPTEFIVYHSLTTSRHYFKEIFTANRTVVFANPSLSVIGNTSISKQSAQRFHLENIYEAMLDQEGSFYFDSKAQKLYYHPNRNETIQTTSTILPVLETVLSIVHVDHVTLDSISIQHTAWPGSTTNTTQPIDGRAAADYLDQWFNAIYLRNSSDISFSSVQLEHIAGYAIQIDRHCSNILIERCRIADLGAGGIRSGIGSSGEVADEDFSQNITVKNCSISDGGHLFPMGVAILLQRGTKNYLISGNTIDHFFHSGIHLGWSWGYDESFCSNHQLSFNYIHHLGQGVLSDLGGIYTSGLLNGTILSNNVVHDIYGYFRQDWGVYLADGSSQVWMTNTIIYNTGSASLTLIYGFNNTFENNVLARASDESDGALSLYHREALDHLSFTFVHNIVYDLGNDSGRWIFQVQAPDPFSAPYVILDYNCYFNIYGNMLIFGLGRLVFSEWQETGHDDESLITDPLFVNAQNQCDFFHLSPSSPAVRGLYFRPIEQLPQWKSGC